MTTLFYAAGAVALAATLMVLTRRAAVHALLYLVVSLLAVAVALFALGAPFVAALEVIIYAGAIIVLFLFVLMLLAGGPEGVIAERRWLTTRALVGPSVLAAALAGLLLVTTHSADWRGAGGGVGPREVGAALFGPYVLAVELASMLLLAALVGAFHLGRRPRSRP